MVAGLLAGSWLPVAAVPAAVALLLVHRRRSDQAAAEAAGRAHVMEACTVLAAELRAGRSPLEALARAAPDAGRLLDEAVAVGWVGGDVPAALRSAAQAPGASGLRHLGACWEVAHETGAGLAAATTRLLDGLRGQAALRREVDLALAGPRATARLLAVLPVVGVLLGTALGAAPLRVLLGTRIGGACLLVGLSLELAGLVWTRHLARAAESAC